MKKFILQILLLFASTILGFALDDGIYAIAHDSGGASVITLDGKRVQLGDKFAYEIQNVSLTSSTNDNTKYFFSLGLIRKNPLKIPEGLVLVLGNKSVLLGPGLIEDSYIGTSICLTDKDFISRVEAFLKITRRDRQHPEDEFTARFITRPEGYPRTGPIIVTLEITNRSVKPFSVFQPSLMSPINDTFLSNAFAFTAYRANSRNLEEEPVTNLPSIRSKESTFKVLTLAPAASQSLNIDLRKYLKLEGPGTFDIRGSYYFPIVNGAKYGEQLWDEYATAEFQVKLN